LRVRVLRDGEVFEEEYELGMRSAGLLLIANTISMILTRSSLRVHDCLMAHRVRPPLTRNPARASANGQSELYVRQFLTTGHLRCHDRRFGRETHSLAGLRTLGEGDVFGQGLDHKAMAAGFSAVLR